MLKAKFRCQSVQKFEGSERAECYPVYGNGEENKSYATATPGGKLELGITNPDAFGYFEPR
jgi:hypothetical protein